jgi:hypothetical protein
MTASWHLAPKRKKFFETYAKTRKFDPNGAENWYKQDLDEIAKLPVSIPGHEKANSLYFSN